jgi:hypothetical protein
MSTGRTVSKWTRVYADGYDLSGMARAVGPLEITYDEADLTAFADTVNGYLRNHAQVNVGTLSSVFDNTATTGIHAVMGTSGVVRTVLVALGMRGAPADGDPCFGGQFRQSGYQANGEGGVMVSIPFSGWDATAATLVYATPWGTLLHANAARTSGSGANAGTGFDNPTGGATTTGGYFLYQVLAGDGTATLSVDDSANNIAFLPLAGATSGEIDCSAVQHGIVALANDADVRQYLRWQIDFNTANTVTFVSAFMRNYP